VRSFLACFPVVADRRPLNAAPFAQRINCLAIKIRKRAFLVVFLVTYGSDLVSRDTDHVIFATFTYLNFQHLCGMVTSGFNGCSLLACKLRIFYCADRRHSLMAKDCGVPVTVLHNNTRSRLDLLRPMSRHSRSSQWYHWPTSNLERPHVSAERFTPRHTAVPLMPQGRTTSDIGPYHL